MTITRKRAMLPGVLLLAGFLGQTLLSHAAPEMALMQLEKPRVSTSGFVQLAGKLTGGPLQSKFVRSDQYIMYAGMGDGSVFVAQDKLGNISFKNGLLKYLNDDAVTLPNSELAVSMARNFLDQNGFAPKNKTELQMMHVGGMNEQQVVDGKPGQINEKLRTIFFGRSIDGIPVTGPGSKMIVHIGNNGEIVGMDRKWREVVTSRPVALQSMKSRDQAQTEIEALLAREWRNAERRAVNSVTLAYYDNDAGYIQPAWVFEATLQEGQEATQYMSAVPAMLAPPEALGPPLRIDPQATKRLLTTGPEKPPVRKPLPTD